MSKKVKKLIGIMLLGGTILTGVLTLNVNKTTEVEEEKVFVLSKNTIEETRLVKVEEIKGDITIMKDLIGYSYNVETTKDYVKGDMWFVTIDKNGVKDIFRK